MKKIALICIAFAMVFLLAQDVAAHPGKTDSNGGHTDHSTGEYHYHHGYPAHQHRDMNGDGIKDCPYNFDDQTDHESGSGNSGNGSGSNSGSGGGPNSGAVVNPPTNPPRQPQNESKDSSEDSGNFWGLVVLSFIVLFYLALCWDNISDYFSNLAERRKQKKENKRILEKLGITNMKVPGYICIVEDGFPTWGPKSQIAPYGLYTKYLSGNGTKFHAKHGCSNAMKPVHLFEALDKYEPCGKCAKYVSRTVPEWYKEIKAKQQEQTRESEKQPIQAEEGKTANQKKYGKVILKSSFVKSVEYQKGVLYLDLGSSGYYAYYNVPVEIFNELITTDSPGRYFHDKINGKYPYVPYHE